MASVCIICHREKSGEAVADTTVIRAIRTAKQKLHMATNNTLVVCSDCMELHAKRRKAYERKWLMHLLLGGALVVLAIGLPLLTGAGFNIFSVFFVLLLAGLVLALALLDYMPPLEHPIMEAPVPQPPALSVPHMDWMSPASASSYTASMGKSSASMHATSRAPPRKASSKSKPRSKSKSKPKAGRR